MRSYPSKEIKARLIAAAQVGIQQQLDADTSNGDVVKAEIMKGPCENNTFQICWRDERSFRFFSIKVKEELM